MKRIVRLAAVVAVGVFGVSQAFASSAPMVFTYEKTCDANGSCTGSVGDVDEDTIKMQVTGFRAAGRAAQLTLTETITVGGTAFTAVLTGHQSPAGFIVLSGTVTSGPFTGAQVHQRSNLDGVDGTKTHWTGELRLMPASS